METPSRDELKRVVGYLAFVNQWLGGTRAVACHLKSVHEHITVLDVAAGGGDIFRSLARRFPNVTVVALDMSEAMLSFGGGTRAGPRRRSVPPFGDRSVDFITTTHFFHHLTDDEIVSILREFDRVARRGIIVNDLLRRRRALAWIRFFTLFANPYVKADGPLGSAGLHRPGDPGPRGPLGLDWLKVRGSTSATVSRLPESGPAVARPRARLTPKS